MAGYANIEDMQKRLRSTLGHLGKGPRTRQQLANLLGVSVPTAVRAVGDLRARGYNVVSVPKDGRGWHYELREHPERQAGALKVLPSAVKLPKEATLREISRLETTHRGKIVAIEPTTGEYFIADTVVKAAVKARAKYPHGTFYFKRIGERAVHSRVGGMQRPHRSR